MNTKKLTLNALLLAIGALLHQVTPALGLPMQPDFSLIMLFVIILLNSKDYKTCLTAALLTGIFSAMTTKFPGGQLPNIIDKAITGNLAFALVYIVNEFIIADYKKYKNIILYILFPLGTLASGTIFLVSALIIVGLPASFTALFLTVVIPATIINLAAGIFIYKVVLLALKRSSY